MTDDFFRILTPKKDAPSSTVSKATGKVLCAVPFGMSFHNRQEREFYKKRDLVHTNKRYLVVGCGPGIYVAPINSESGRSPYVSVSLLTVIYLEYKWVLNYRNPTALMALTTLGRKSFNRLIVHTDSTLFSYSLDMLYRVALGQTQRQTLDASIERICAHDANVILCKHVHIAGRALRRFMHASQSSSIL